MRSLGTKLHSWFAKATVELRVVGWALACMWQRKRWFGPMLLLSLVTALTEGASVALVVPILQDEGSLRSLGSTPVVGGLLVWTGSLPLAQRLQVVAIALMVLVLVRGVLMYATQVLSVYVPFGIELDLRTRALNGLLRARMQFVDRLEHGQMVTALENHPAKLATVVRSVANGMLSLFLLLTYITLMLLVSWQMTLFSITTLGMISVLIKWLTQERVKLAGVEVNRATREASAAGMQIFTSAKLIRLAVAERYIAERYRRVVRGMHRAQFRLMALTSLIQPLFTTLAGGIVALVLFASPYFFADTTSNWTGLVLLFLLVLYRVTGPISVLNDTRTIIDAHVDSFNLLNSFLDESAAHAEPSGGVTVSHLKRDIRLEGVSLTYEFSQVPAVHELDLSIRKGEMLAVVGTSGAGKTTLVGLLTGLYEPTAGRLLIDDVEFAALDLKSWRRRIRVVPQEVTLFNDTIAENIRFGNWECSDEEVLRAADLAEVSAFVERMDKGLQTRIGERGTRLSGGQRQRIALARALVGNYDLLLLDEATSHLDVHTEKAIQRGLEEVRKKRTLVVIAHRLSTVRGADRIIVLDNGRIVEQGTHDELLRTRGPYWEMIDQQRFSNVDGSDETGGNGTPAHAADVCSDAVDSIGPDRGTEG